MNLIILHGLILLVLSVTIMPKVCVAENGWPLMETDIPLKKCQYFRDKTMLTCSCQNRNLEEIPSTLRSEIEVLDLSVNRLVHIKKDTLSRFTSLKYLDLHDNFLRDIDEEAFESLNDLKVLDLTKTISETLPKGLFTLPHLEKLYIENNKLTESIFKTKVKSPLNVIYAATNSFKQFPKLGPFPTLLYINVSHNEISEISVDDIAPYCRLITLDVSHNPIRFDPSNCNCQNFNAWIKQHNITVRPIFNCPNNPNLNCSENFSNRTLSLYQECEEIIKEKIETERAKSTWILVLSCVSGSLFCIFFFLYCIHRRNKKRHRKLKKEQQLTANNANTELLNSNLQEQS